MTGPDGPMLDLPEVYRGPDDLFDAPDPPGVPDLDALLNVTPDQEITT